MNKKICYLTYQSFPSETANSLQTISNINYLIKNNMDVDLIFPLREVTSTDEWKCLKDFYSIKYNFNVKGLPHNLPFGKYNFLNRLFFHISHLFWSYKSVNYVRKKLSNFDAFITRSDWILYFLSKQNCNVLFECHQLTKLRRIILKHSLKKNNVKVICLNKTIYEKINSFVKYKDQALVLHNGFDSELIENFNPTKKISNQIVFVGNLKRFGKDRGIDQLLSVFSIDNIANNYCLKIIGGPKDEVIKLKKEVKKLKLDSSIKILGRLDRKETLKIVSESEIGILINSDNDPHSRLYTSPLKYFEYIACNLKIVAVDFISHRVLPGNQFINFFEYNDLSSLANAIRDERKINKNFQISEFSLDSRAKSIINFLFK